MTTADLREALQCPVCFEQFDLESRQPIDLDCRHNLCAECVQSIIRTQGHGAKTVSCPECRAQTGTKKALQAKNKVAMGVLEAQLKAQKPKDEEIRATPYTEEQARLLNIARTFLQGPDWKMRLGHHEVMKAKTEADNAMLRIIEFEGRSTDPQGRLIKMTEQEEKIHKFFQTGQTNLLDQNVTTKKK